MMKSQWRKLPLEAQETYRESSKADRKRYSGEKKEFNLAMSRTNPDKVMQTQNEMLRRIKERAAIKMTNKKLMQKLTKKGYLRNDYYNPKVVKTKTKQSVKHLLEAKKRSGPKL